MQQYQMTTTVERASGFMLDREFCPTFYPKDEGYRLLLQKERKLITITDPHDPNRDVMAELFGERLSSSLTAAPVPECSDIVETPVTSTPKEAESNTAPASETRQSRKKLCKRPGLLLFSIPPEEKTQQKKTEKANRRKRTIPNQTEVHKPAEPVTFCIPLSEEEEEEVKKAKMVFGELDGHLTATPPAGGDTVDVPAPLNTTPPQEAEPGELLAEHLTATPPAGGDTVDVPAPLNTTPPQEAEPGELLAEHLTATPPAGGDNVHVSAPLNTTPTKEAEPNTAPASETSQSEQNLCNRPGLLLISSPPEEKRKQKKTEKANLRKKKEEKQTEVTKTLSQKKTLKPCICLPGEKNKEVKNSKNTHKEKKQVRFCLPPTPEVEQKDEKKKHGRKMRSGRSD